jgi:hypothetical protein
MDLGTLIIMGVSDLIKKKYNEHQDAKAEMKSKVSDNPTWSKSDEEYYQRHVAKKPQPEAGKKQIAAPQSFMDKHTKPKVSKPAPATKAPVPRKPQYKPAQKPRSPSTQSYVTFGAINRNIAIGSANTARGTHAVNQGVNSYNAHMSNHQNDYGAGLSDIEKNMADYDKKMRKLFW